MFSFSPLLTFFKLKKVIFFFLLPGVFPEKCRYPRLWCRMSGAANPSCRWVPDTRDSSGQSCPTPTTYIVIGEARPAWSESRPECPHCPWPGAGRVRPELWALSSRPAAVTKRLAAGSAKICPRTWFYARTAGLWSRMRSQCGWEGHVTGAGRSSGWTRPMCHYPRTRPTRSARIGPLWHLLQMCLWLRLWL